MSLGSPEVIKRYEESFGSSFPGEMQAFSFWKGRVALYAILEALGIGQGDEVIVPGFTCVVVPNAVIYRGASPVYVDIESHTFNINPSSLERALTSKTKAIIVQHTFGIPSDIDAIGALAKEAGVTVIEDSAHALGCLYKGQPVGTLGNAAFFSFQWSKSYTTGLGGIALTKDSALVECLNRVQDAYMWPARREVAILWFQGLLYRCLFTPRLSWTAKAVLERLSHYGLFIGSSEKEELDCCRPGEFEKRMSTFQASWGLYELTHFGSVVAHRRRIGQLYHHSLLKEGFQTVQIPPYADAVFLRYPLLVKDKQAVLNRACVNRVEIGSWFESVLHPDGSPLEKAGYTLGQCPVGEEVARHIINLPTHPRVTEEEVIRVVRFLKEMRDKGYV